MSTARCRYWLASAPPLFRGFLFLGLLCCCSLLLAQTGGAPPLSIQQIVIKPERAAKELEKAGPGTLQLLPRSDFDARLERVRKAEQRQAQKPHLIRAHYSAELIDRSFTHGSGQWNIMNAGPTAAILPIEPLNLALARVKWEQGGDAILADFDGKAPGLLVKETGAQTCLFDWSARGETTNNGTVFDLAVPNCPRSTFEFKLPADSILVATKDGAIVTGPHDAESPGKRLWKLQVAGAMPIAVSVRKVAEPKSAATTIFARVHSIQKLAPERVEIEHEFQIDVLHGSIRELILDGDTPEPYAVSGPDGLLKSWKWQEAPAKKDAKGKSTSAGQLTLEFNQPVQGKIKDVRIRSLMTRNRQSVWTSPTLHVRDALPRGETLEVRLHPSLALGKWDHGSFQPTQIATENDGTQIFTLVPSTVTAGLTRRPTMAAPLPGVDLHTTEKHLWQLTPRTATLAAEIQYSVTRGSPFELRVKLPDASLGYQIETLELQPADWLAGWHPDGGMVHVDLKQPLVQEKKATLKIKMRAPLRLFAADLRLPELAPIDAGRRAGTLEVAIDPTFRAQLLSSSVPLAAADPTTSGNYRFTFRDQRLAAVVRLTPQPVQVQLRGAHTIALSEQHAALQYHWDVEPLVGSPEFLDFRLGPDFPSAWKVVPDKDAPRIHHWERLPLQEALPHLLHLGSGPGMPAVALATMLPKGAHWRLHLSEPLRSKTGFTLQATAAAGKNALGGHAWSIPLMTPVQRSNVEQTVNVESPGEPIVKVRADGSLQPSPALSPNAASPQVRFNQVNNPPEHASTISVWTQPQKQASSQLELCDEARTTTYVHKDGRVFYRIQFRLWHWHDPACEVRLPPGAAVIAARAHDRWLQRLDANEARDGVRLSLPYDRNAPFVRYVILVRAEQASSALPGVLKIQVPRIGWPVAPLDVRARFFLENGWTPLVQESLAPVGVPARIAGQSATLRWARSAWNAGQSWFPFGERAQLAQQSDEQQQIVLQAERKLHSADPKAMKFAPLLERLATIPRDPIPLVIDRLAFQELGVNPETMIPASALALQSGRPFWESLGLVYLPCPSGAVLTSARRMQTLGIDNPDQAAELDGAVQEAILHGWDASTGFGLFVAWIRQPHGDSEESNSDMLAFASERDGDPAQMSEWEFRAGEMSDQFHVVDVTLARTAGGVLAILAALLIGIVGRRLEWHVSYRVCVLALAITTVMAVWTPLNVREFFVLPMLAVEGAAILWCIIRILAGRTEQPAGANSTISKRLTAGALVGILLASAAWNAAAQTPAPRTHTVFVIDGPKPAVLVSPELLAKLDEIENQTVAGSTGAVLVSAKYAGRIQDTQAKFDAVYEVHSFKDKTSVIVPLAGTPFAGVQLTEALLDGAPIFPAPHKAGLLVPIRTKGAHTLRVAFTIRTTAEDDQVKLQFTIPKLAQNEIKITGLAPAQKLQCVNCLGEDKWLPDGAQPAKVWHADLGYESSVHLRWAGAAIEPAPKAIEVREHHFWDLHPASLSLTTSLSYTLGKTNLAQFVIALPEGLHVRNVEATSATPTGRLGGLGDLVVRRWDIVGKNDQRRLIVSLAQAATGNVTLNLEIVPHAFMPPGKLLLPLPAPLQGKSVAGLLGYRLDVTEIEPRAQNLAPQSITAEEFEKQWKKQPTPVTRAYTFQRKAAKAWMELITQPNTPMATGQLRWDVDYHHADLQGKFTVRSSREDLVFLEFFIGPSMTLADVAGPDVHRWHIQDALLQVWLRQPRKETTVMLHGWSRPGTLKSTLPAPGLFALPSVFPLHAQLGAVTLDARPAAGIALTTESSRNLRPNPTDPHQFTIDKASYEAAFRLTPMTQAPQAVMLTKVQRTEQGIDFWHGIHLRPERGQLPNLTLHLKDWPYEVMQVDAPGATVVDITDKATKQPAWTLKYADRLPRDVHVILHGRVAKDMQPSVPVPVLNLDGAAIRSHALVWKDVEIHQSGTGKPVVPLKSSETIKQALPEAWFKSLSAWNWAPAAGSLKAVPPTTLPRNSVRVLASSEEARLLATGRWLHSASYWVHAPTATEMRFRFPGAVEACNVWTDRRLQPTLDPAAQEFTLPLVASPAPQRVELRWQAAASSERPDAPTIAAVQIGQAPLPAHERTVWVPAGMSAKSNTSATRLARLLNEARRHMHVAAALAEEPLRSDDTARQIADRQRAFHDCLRQAEYLLAIAKYAGAAHETESGREGRGTLQQENARLAKQHDFDPAPPRTPMSIPSHVWDEPGIAGIPVVLPSDLSNLPLQSDHDRTMSRRQTRCALVVLAAAFLLIFSVIRQSWTMLRSIAPEAGIAILAVAMVCGGPSIIAAMLVGVLVVIRSVWIAATVKRWLAHGPDAQGAPPPAGVQSPPAPTG